MVERVRPSAEGLNLLDFEATLHKMGREAIGVAEESRMKKTVGLAAVLVACLLVAAMVSVADDSALGKTSSTRPPRNLKKVGDHWTPWDPPAAGPNDYIIKKGDTLWDLGQQWLGNPFLWPQIWDQNRYIQDSHWIYPGDPLVQPSKPTVVPPEGPPPGTTGAEADAQPEPRAGAQAPASAPRSTGALAPARRLLPLAWGHDVYCSGYIDPQHTFSDTWVAGRESEAIGVSIGDVIYVNKGRNQGLQAGADLAIERKAGPVVHPASEAPIGDLMQRLGKARVLCAQDEKSMAVIVEACEPVYDSDELVPWKDIPIPGANTMPAFDRNCSEPSGGPQGYVVAIKDSVAAAGVGQIIHTDLGEGTGLKPGQFLSLYRDNGEFPRLMIGQAMVLTVESGTSTAKITRSVRDLAAGDRVEVMR